MIFKKILLLIVLTLGCFFAADFVLAQPEVGTNFAENIGLQGGGEDVRSILVKFIQIALGFLSIIAVLFVMWGGWMWTTSGGDPAKIDRAKKTLVSAAIGLVIMLSAFMIVTFILNSTSTSLTPSTGTCGSGPACTGTTVCCSGSCQTPPCSSITPSANLFYITGVVPVDTSENNIRNTAVKVFFNRPLSAIISPADINSNFVVEMIGENLDTVETFPAPAIVGRDGDVTLDINRRSMMFKTDGLCGGGVLATNCFSQWSRFQVTINSGMANLSTDDPIIAPGLDCGAGIGCVFDFATDDSIDLSPPVATAIPRQMCFDDLSGSMIVDSNTVRGMGSDDYGIGEIRFFQQPAAGPVTYMLPSFIGAGNRYQQENWTFDTTAPGMAVGDDFTFGIEVDDYVPQTDVNSFDRTIRETHCCNGMLDPGEVEVDCGGPDCDICGGIPRIDWITPNGGFCRDINDAPLNIFCTDDTPCGTGSCDLSTPNGADGNFVTISGRYFGTTAGRVEFRDAANNIAIAYLANDAANGGNASCGPDTDVWQDDQIIVIVPNLPTLGTGTVVTVIRDIDSAIDTTDIYGNGPVFDFVLNTIIRPGICLVSPDNGVSNTPLTYQGIRLVNNTTAHFGVTNDYINALNMNFTGAPDTTGGAMLPVLQPSLTTTFVFNPSSINSNYLRFTKIPDPYTGPYITSFSPDAGPVDQYVTIHGDGFGNPNISEIGSSYHVYFDEDRDILTPGDQFEASYDFPDVCADSLWRDTQIVVKVPAGMTDLSNYLFFVDIDGTVIDSTGVVNDTGALSETFQYDSSIDLAPGLCKLVPIMGPNESDVYLWGEYFKNPDAMGPNTSMVWFHLNESVTGFSALNWRAVGDAEKIDTVVPTNAITGYISVEDTYGSVGNELSFTVGTCTDAPNPDAACGVQICCPAGTIEVGQCANTVDDCYGDLGSSVYEWGFDVGTTSSPFIACYDGNPLGNCNPLAGTCSTGICDPVSCTCQPDPGDSCAGFNLLQCASLLGCPNSPGDCSVGLFDETPTSCDCEDYYFGAGLAYNTTENKCEDAVSVCSVDEDAVIGLADMSLYDAYCAEINGNYYWQMNPGSSSCPDSNWIINTLGDCTLAVGGSGVTCTPCGTGLDYECEPSGASDNDGTCMVNRLICSNTSTSCNASDECVDPTTPSNSCECCCRIANSDQDCCSYEDPVGSGTFIPLTCGGDCGDDAVEVAAGNPDPNVYGSCTGCSAAPNPDEACNCGDTTGKYCDTTGAGGAGVCRDCAQLPDSTECALHPATCCVDAENSNACRGGDGTLLGGGFCAYFDCALVGGCDFTPNTTGTFPDTTSCSAGCTAFGIPGGLSCFDTLSGNCGLTCAAPYNCTGETGCSAGGCGANDESCLCCCDATNPLSCAAAGLSGLTCLESEPCSSPVNDERGLCCGCTADADCVASGDPTAVGCGFDTCCRPRPFVTTTMPLDNNTNVCRNVLVSADFNEAMNSSSFSGNILLVGDYVYDTCPDNTNFLTLNSDSKEKYKNIFVRTFYKLVSNISIFLQSILPSKLSAYFNHTVFDHNYCAVSGSSGGYTNAAGNGVAEFAINNVLDANRDYFVIIKGDDNLDGSRGVKNAYNVAMNAAAMSPSGNLVIDKTFNGIYFENAYIWSFRTMDLNVANEGICEIDHIRMVPESWLFRTNVNDANEVDTDANDTNFNTTDDSDKEFSAIAVSAGDIDLAPIVGLYNWAWSWLSNNLGVAEIITPVTNLDSNRSLVRANPTSVDGQTTVDATAAIIDNTIGAAPGPYVGNADVYVFLCDNPWPPFSQGPTPPAGNWEPWRDTNLNCTIGATCDNANYEIYYCRDLGGQSTIDDLPAIMSDNTIIRGRSNFACDGGYYSGNTCAMGSVDCELPAIPASHTCNNGTCTGEAATGGRCVVDSDCDVSGICDGILKDSYFFREALPDISSVSLTVDSVPTTGGSVILSWAPVVPIGIEVLDSYVLYYGTNSGNYTDFIDVPLSGSPYTVIGLNNGVRYYFSLTARYVSGAESEYSAQVFATPEDVSQTGIPSNFIAMPSDGLVELTWDANSGDDTTGYEICYGMSDIGNGLCANIVDMGVDTALDIDSLNNGVTYYFGVRAYDVSGNTSSLNSSSGRPFAAVYSPQAVADSVVNSEIDLAWSLDLSGANNSGVSGVNVYWSDVEGDFTINPPIYLAPAPSSYTATGLTADTTYYFKFTTIDNSGSSIESPDSGEVEATTIN